MFNILSLGSVPGTAVGGSQQAGLPSGPGSRGDDAGAGFALPSQTETEVNADQSAAAEEAVAVDVTDPDDLALPLVPEIQVQPSTPVVGALRVALDLDAASPSVAAVTGDVAVDVPDADADAAVGTVPVAEIAGDSEPFVEPVPETEAAPEVGPVQDAAPRAPLATQAVAAPTTVAPIAPMAAASLAEDPAQMAAPVTAAALDDAGSPAAPAQANATDASSIADRQMADVAGFENLVDEGSTTQAARAQMPEAEIEPARIREPAAARQPAPAAETARPEPSALTRNVLERLEEVQLGDGITRILLRPRGMGVLEFDLSTMVDGRMRVAIRVENPMLLDALKADGGALGQFLDERGFDMSQGEPELERYTPPEAGDTNETDDASGTQSATAIAEQPRPTVRGTGLVDIIT